MSLSDQQARTVRGTVPALIDHGEEITSTFYRNMLRAHPELHNVFNNVNLSNGRLPRALTAVLLRFASNLHDISELIPRLERTCHKHCSLGILPDHYEIVEEYLLDAFAEVLGPAMTREVRFAWQKAYWVLARMLIAREDQMYRGFDPAWKGWRRFKIVKKVHEADAVFSFYLAPKDGKPLPTFVPGQYVSARLKVTSIGCTQPRQYALSDSPKTKYYRITVKRDRVTQVEKVATKMNINPGLVSNSLVDDKEVGDEIDLSHPAGENFLDPYLPSSTPLVLVSAGVGLAPAISMLNYLAETNSKQPVSFVHGSQSEMPFRDHVRKLKAELMPNLTVNIFNSRLAEADLIGVEYEYSARVDLDAVGSRDLYLEHGAAEYFICGPEQFMAEMSDYLVLHGVSLRRVKLSPFSTGEPGLEARP